jgi:hypothetical protein
MNKRGRPSKLQKLSLEAQSSNTGENKSPYVHIPGAPFTPPQGITLKNRSVLPFACKRCLYPLETLQTHTLNKNQTTEVICLGTCLDVLRGKQEAKEELNIESLENFYNVFKIPDSLLAQAMNIDLVNHHYQEKVIEKAYDETTNVDEGAQLSQSTA